MVKRKTNTRMTKKERRQLVQIAEYLVSGGAFFWTGYLVFFLADKGFGWELWWAKLVANLSGWVVNYILQRYWVFKSKKLNKHQTEVTLRYGTITIVNFILDYLIISTLKELGITPYIGQFGSAGFFTVWNYFWYRFWVFPSHSHRHKRHSTA